MKKKFLVVLLCVISFIGLSSVENVKAASGCTWMVNDTFASVKEYSKDGSYYLEFDESYGTILVLDNFDGGNLVFDAFGTCLTPKPAIIKLIGDNKITVNEGTGIRSISDIKFIGNGSLMINANVPIEYKYSGHSIIINGVPEETEKDENLQQPEINEDEKYAQDNDTTASEFNFYTIINPTLLGINIILLIILIIKVCKKGK